MQGSTRFIKSMKDHMKYFHSGGTEKWLENVCHNVWASND